MPIPASIATSTSSAAGNLKRPEKPFRLPAGGRFWIWQYGKLHYLCSGIDGNFLKHLTYNENTKNLEHLPACYGPVDARLVCRTPACRASAAAPSASCCTAPSGLRAPSSEAPEAPEAPEEAQTAQTAEEASAFAPDARCPGQSAAGPRNPAGFRTVDGSAVAVGAGCRLLCTPDRKRSRGVLFQSLTTK